MKTWADYTKKELLALPERKFDEVKVYSSVLLVNTCKKHSSGYNLFAVIGVDDNDEPVEICGYMDDFRMGDTRAKEDFSTIKFYDIGIDCSMHGVFRIHGFYSDVEVGINTSTTSFRFIERGLK